MTDLLDAVLWQRLDQPAFEICRLWQRQDSWRLEGTGLMAVEGIPAQIRYEVLCNQRWETALARIALIQGPSTRTLELRRGEDGRWSRDGEPMDGLDGTTDVDLSFTPATNTLPIRRLSLEVGASASVSTAWLKMRDASERGNGTDAQAVHPWALALWALIAAVVVVALFPLLHSIMSHALAIVTAGIGGVVVGAVGYRMIGGRSAGRGAALAAGLGGIIGVLALHVLPLLH